MGIYKFGNNTYPRRKRRRSNSGHFLGGKKCGLWVGKYSTWVQNHTVSSVYTKLTIPQIGSTYCEYRICKF